MVILSIASRVYCIIIIQVLPSPRKRQTICSYNTSSQYHSQSHHAQRYTLLADQTNNESRHRKGSPMTLDHWSNSLYVHEWHGTRNYCKWQWLVVLLGKESGNTNTTWLSLFLLTTLVQHEWMGCVRIKCRFAVTVHGHKTASNSSRSVHWSHKVRRGKMQATRYRKDELHIKSLVVESNGHAKHFSDDCILWKFTTVLCVFLRPHSTPPQTSPDYIISHCMQDTAIILFTTGRATIKRLGCVMP